MSGFFWSFILGIDDDLLRAIRKIVSRMIKIIVIIMIINRLLASLH